MFTQLRCSAFNFWNLKVLPVLETIIPAESHTFGNPEKRELVWLGITLKKVAMLGMEGCSLYIGAGHVMTRRDHLCGEFRDTFDWPSLPLPYLKRIGAPLSKGERT